MQPPTDRSPAYYKWLRSKLDNWSNESVRRRRKEHTLYRDRITVVVNHHQNCLASLAAKILCAGDYLYDFADDGAAVNEQLVKWFDSFETQDNASWKETFHMCRETFEYLSRELEESIDSTEMSERVILAIALWQLANSSSQYNMHDKLYSACNGIVKILKPRVIGIPSGTYLEQVLQGFEQICGLTQCGGVVGVVELPRGGKKVAFRLLVDHRGLISDFCMLPSEDNIADRFPTRHKGIRGSNIPIFVVGNASFSLQPQLLVPFTHAERDYEKSFNASIERALAILRQTVHKLETRWAVLSNMCTFKSVENILTACCVLHNVCEVRGDLFEISCTPPPDTTLKICEGSVNDDSKPSTCGIATRNALALYIHEKAKHC